MGGCCVGVDLTSSWRSSSSSSTSTDSWARITRISRVNNQSVLGPVAVLAKAPKGRHYSGRKAKTNRITKRNRRSETRRGEAAQTQMSLSVACECEKGARMLEGRFDLWLPIFRRMIVESSSALGWAVRIFPLLGPAEPFCSRLKPTLEQPC